MLKQDAETAFDLIISLFTDRLSWHVREKPIWRTWAFGYKSGSTYGQMAIEIRWYVEQLLAVAGSNTNRWCALLRLCGDIHDDQYDLILAKYESELASNAFDDESRRILWETLNAYLVRLEWDASRRQLKNGDVVDEKELGPDDESELHFPGRVHCQAIFGQRLQQLLHASKPNDAVLAGCHAFVIVPGGNHFSNHFSDRFNYEKHCERISDGAEIDCAKCSAK